MVLEVLRADESLQIDEILEILETQLTSSEVLRPSSSWRSRAAFAACRERIMCAPCEIAGKFSALMSMQHEIRGLFAHSAPHLRVLMREAAGRK